MLLAVKAIGGIVVIIIVILLVVLIARSNWYRSLHTYAQSSNGCGKCGRRTLPKWNR